MEKKSIGRWLTALYLLIIAILVEFFIYVWASLRKFLPLPWI